MGKENISQELRWKNIEKINNYFIKDINQNKLMSMKQKMVCTILNYTKHFLILLVAGTILTSAFASLVGIPVGIMSSALGLKILNNCSN